MARVFLLFFLIVFPGLNHAFAQAEIAAQRFEQGLTNAHRGRFASALNDFKDALEKYKFASGRSDGFAAKLNYNIGVCLYRTGRGGEAVYFLEAAIKLAKNRYAQAFHALGMVESERGDRAAAKRAFESAVRLNERDGESWFDLAMLFLAEKDFVNAATALQKAIRYGSADSAMAHNNLGVIAAIEGDWTKAERQFETALALTGGKLQEARRNWKLCRSPNRRRVLIARLGFVKREINAN